MEFFEKLEKNPFEDLKWNIPEQKLGAINVIGGNSRNFRTSVRVSELLGKNFPIRTINTVLPDVLKGKLPDLPNFYFLRSTDSGSFLDAEEISRTIEGADFNILIGDFSKNTTTGRAVASASKIAARPLLITRDTVDLIAENNPEKTLLNERVLIFASMAQIQKLFRAVYYPKMLLLSQSLVQVAEILHKFTLSYPVTIITLQSGQLIVAKDGEVKAIALGESGFSPITVWGGELAAKIAMLNLFNPEKFLEATTCALFQ